MMTWNVANVCKSIATYYYPEETPQDQVNKSVELSKSLMMHGRYSEAIDACLDGLAFHPKFLRAFRTDQSAINWKPSEVWMPINPQGRLWEKGRSVVNETLLLFSLGNASHLYLFAKLIPCLLEKGVKKIYLLMPDGIIDLFKRFFSSYPEVELILDLTDAEGWTVCMPVNLLPKVCEIDAEAFPRSPYLVADTKIKAKLKDLVPACAFSLRIGVILPKELHLQAAMVFLKSLENVGTLVLLHGATGYVENSIVDLRPKLSEWWKKAAAIDLCDVIITCDGSLAHLSAGLGKPTLVLVKEEAHPLWAKRLLYENVAEFRLDDWKNLSSRLYSHFEDEKNKWTQNL